MPKLSQIAAGTQPASTDTIIGVQSGTTDAQYTLAQVAAATQLINGAPVGPSFVATFWYQAPIFDVAAGVALVAGSTYFQPVFIQTKCTIEAIAYNATVGAAGGAVFWNVGVYSHNATTNRPNSLLGSGAGSNSTGTGAVSLALNANVAITTLGWYWLAFQASDTTQRLLGIGQAGGVAAIMPQMMGSATLSRAVAQSAVGSNILGLSVTGSVQTVAGIGNITIPSSPSSFTEVITGGQIPGLSYQIVSVP